MTNQKAIGVISECRHCRKKNHDGTCNEHIFGCFEAKLKAIEAFNFVEEIKELAFNTGDEVLCRKLAKYGFVRKENDEWVRE